MVKRFNRRRPDKSQESPPPAVPDAIAISFREVADLIEVIEHTHAQITKLSDLDKGTVADASGSALVPLLYARAGFASIQGRHKIPFLVDEIGLLEAAVVNLESYEGSWVVLCTGYQLLNIFATRERNSSPLQFVHGIPTFGGEAGDTTNGSVAPSLA